MRREHKVGRLVWKLRLGAAALPAMLILVASLATAPSRSTESEPFLVVVNGSNPISALSAQEVSSALMRKMRSWPDGVAVAPVDLKESTAVRESFSRQIHGKSSSAVRAYWQRMIFSGREVPPPEKGTSAEVLIHVRAHRGAIGYVAASADLGSGVKVVAVTP